MTRMDRRKFLRAAAAGAALGVFPPSIQRALAIPANNTTGTINDIEHVIIFMQENRSFDHYFGTLGGVRGFSDRITIPQASGNPIWYQQGTSGEVQPYYLDSGTNSTQYDGLIIGGGHDWSDQHAAWDNGRMAAWPKGKSLDASVGYLEQSDLSFHWALANAFTVCDAYHTSQLGPTFPNRTFMWSGTNGTNAAGVCMTTNDTWGYTVQSADGLSGTIGSPSKGFTWTTVPERLQAAGISWKVYQSPTNNSNNNQLSAFATYRAAVETLIQQGQSLSTPWSPAMDSISPLLRGVANTMSDGGYLQAVADDIAAGTLPQVSWVIAPAQYSEHPGSSIPTEGAWYIQTLLDMLTANPDVWSRTVLIINYDENDTFFDHVPPPAAPSKNPDGTYAGNSTVDTQYEYFNFPTPPGGTVFSGTDGTPDGSVIGPCVRVPTLIVSPWSVGGWVNSQVFDHTSTIRFLEQRFGIEETNITPWRRAVFGDLTSCFDFANPQNGLPTLVAAPTRAQADALYASQSSAPSVPVPAVGSVPLPTQPQTSRPSRALPYHLHTSADVDATNGVVWLTFSNTGTQGAVFHVYDQFNLSAIPRRYTVEAGKENSDSWTPVTGQQGQYSLFVLGPNGYHRLFEGNLTDVVEVVGGASGPIPEVRVCYDHVNNAVYLTIMNIGNAPATATVIANAYRTDGPWTYTVPPGMQVEPSWNLSASGGWYDFTLTIPEGGFVRRFAGRVETGKDSISDPAMGVSASS